MEPISFDKPASAARQADEPQVGEFRQATPLSQWALARYLVGRSVASSIGSTLLLIVLAGAALTVVLWLLVDQHVWAVLVGVITLFVLLFRTLLMGIVNRLTAVKAYRPLEDRLHAMVGDTKADVLAELRRIGLPGRIWSLPLLAVRLVRGKTRAETFQALRRFELGRVVPPARVDELHLLLKQAVGR